MIRSSYCILATCVLFSACDTGGTERPLSAVRDSAGVRIVEVPGVSADVTPNWRIGVRPSLTIGVVEGRDEYQFSSVRGAVRLSDGRIAVLDGGTRQLRIYAADGSHVSSSGRRGSGPGEFQLPTQLTRLSGDTLLVWDAQRQTRSWFNPEGRFITSQLADRGHWEGRFGPAVVTDVTSLLPDGSLLLRIRPARYPAELGWDRPPLGFARASPDLSTVDSIGWFRGTENYNVGTESQPLLRSVLFGRSTRIAAGGTPMRLYIGGMERRIGGYDVHVYDSRGRLESILRHNVPERPLSPEEIEEAREYERAMYESGSSPRPEEWIAEQLRSMPIPPSAPPHGDLHVDSEGNLWVQEWRMPNSGQQRYNIFDPTGSAIGSLSLSGKFRITDIGNDYVLGLWRDANGVEFVHLYTLEK